MMGAAISPGLGWFARHEARLALRDLVSFLTAGRRRRLLTAVFWILVVEALLHGLAFTALRPATMLSGAPTRSVLILLTGIGFLSLALMLAQAMESVTRVLYGRADLDLLLSSPARTQGLFALRTGMTAFGTTAMALFLVGPFINAAAVLHAPGWLAAYGVVFAMGAIAAAGALLVTLALFRLIGPSRTRLVAQIVAAVIGAGFVIGGQAAGILLYGDIGRLAIISSPAASRLAPDADSLLWWPARAAAGDVGALAAVLCASLGLFAVSTIVAGNRFAAIAAAAAGTTAVRASRRPESVRFTSASPRTWMRRKELRLLLRDPWLISQTLMQILYLLPPGLMLWLNFGREVDTTAVIVPIVVMAAGQLAGGLAWLTISGEDAPDLIATAPVTAATAMRAKVEAVLVAVAVPMAPVLVLLALADPRVAVIAVAAVVASTAASTAIQFLFRTAARRSQFRRRQTASRIATFAEAFSSISWAGAAGLAAAGTTLAVIPAAVALIVLLVAWIASPSRSA
jgi:ABC-2 type transport system permease protein